MAIVFPNSFIVTVAEPIDSRLVMTKAQMLAARSTRMPNYYFVLCSDDKRIYIYDKTASLDPVVGNFRPIEEFLNFASPTAKAQFEAAIEGSAKIQDLSSKVGDAETAGTLIYNVNELQENVTVLEENVSDLEVKVCDEDTGLIKRVDKAQDDISSIETWIKNVKLDGGEIKARYTLSLVDCVGVQLDSEDRTIEYKTEKIFEFDVLTGYTLPSSITVCGVNVGPADTDCGNTIASWVVSKYDDEKPYGKLTVKNTTNNVTCTIVATQEV